MKMRENSQMIPSIFFKTERYPSPNPSRKTVKDTQKTPKHNDTKKMVTDYCQKKIFKHDKFIGETVFAMKNSQKLMPTIPRS